MTEPTRAACGPHPIHITPTTLGAKVDVSPWLRTVLADITAHDGDVLDEIRAWDEYIAHDAQTETERARGRREVAKHIEALAEKHGSLITTAPQAVRIAQALTQTTTTLKEAAL